MEIVDRFICLCILVFGNGTYYGKLSDIYLYLSKQSRNIFNYLEISNLIVDIGRSIRDIFDSNEIYLNEKKSPEIASDVFLIWLEISLNRFEGIYKLRDTFSSI